MTAKTARRKPADVFDVVRSVGLELPGVEATTKRATKRTTVPVLKRDGCFMAGLAVHASAEPGTLVVRADVDDNVDLYGREIAPKDVVMKGTVTAPAVTEAFMAALRREK